MLWRETDIEVEAGEYEGEYFGYCGLAGRPEESEFAGARERQRDALRRKLAKLELEKEKK
jgi:hypothetical protein